ncbi:hypothetical protein CEXT_354501 [Caerostris extrusa]|uniref:Uncharacterized protein n=1 Tax=Caerostris extrusa TaxID=172846 RepID=A0AAV4XD02_CAEEX|nr:hypothetical protein CEXT_354501 [Caerostris extrusa]
MSQYTSTSTYQRRRSRIAGQTSCHLRRLTSCANKSGFEQNLTFHCPGRIYTKETSSVENNRNEIVCRYQVSMDKSCCRQIVSDRYYLVPWT